MNLRVASVLLVAAFVCSLTDASAEIKIGMLAQRGAETALKEWGGLEQYLSDRMGEKVTIVPLKFTEFMDFCQMEPTALIFTNPWFYVRAKVMNGARALVTVRYHGSGSMMGGVIFTRRDSAINTLADLRGKTLMCPKFSSPGGWLFQKGELVKAGLVPEHDFVQLLETPNESHDAVVYAVRDGKVDVGTVRTNLLETMQREGKIDMRDFRVLNEMRQPGFPEVCSTPLYPDWPVASLRDTPPQVALKVKKVFLAIPQGHAALEQARKIESFVDALDYAPMEELCRLVKAKPFLAQRSTSQPRQQSEHRPGL
jgi:ABC-type phosphate/phosphonate transport system substrate-binding protein